MFYGQLDGIIYVKILKNRIVISIYSKKVFVCKVDVFM